MTRTNALLGKAVLVLALGAIGMATPRAAAARAPLDPLFCARCVEGTGCGLEEQLCAAWGCSVGKATCGELGDCNQNNNELLIVCNT